MSTFKKLFGLFIGTAFGGWVTFSYILDKASFVELITGVIFIYPFIIFIHLSIMHVVIKLISSTKGIFYASSAISISYGVLRDRFFDGNNFDGIYLYDLSMVLSFLFIGFGYFSVYAMQKQWALEKLNQ